MAVRPHPNPGRLSIQGRASERQVLEQVVASARDGSSAVLVVHGEAGIGKTTLLDDAAAGAGDVLVLRVEGVEAEAELGFAALHRLLAPVAHRITGLPVRQRHALETTFGLGDHDSPDRFLTGLAALTLLDDVACDQPVLCIVDDGQWLDRESLEILSFVGRRLAAESIALVFGFRDSVDAPAALPEGLPRLPLGPLDEAEATALLHSVAQAPVDAAVASRIVEETAGSPLAITELGRVLTPEQLLGADQLPLALPIGERLRRHYLEVVAGLPEDTRLLLLVAAADTTGDPGVVAGAASQLGLGPGAGDPAEHAGLIRLAPTVSFRHPLVRSAVLGAADPARIRHVHAALAAATDGERFGDSPVWHLAASTLAPNDTIADLLVDHADKMRLRGGLAAEAALRTRAAELTSDPDARSHRMMEAVQAHFLAGAHHRVTGILDETPFDHDPVLAAQALQLRALLVAYATPGPAPEMLLRAASLAADHDAGLARTLYTEALQAAMVSCQLSAGVTPASVARDVDAATRTAGPERADGVVDGLRRGFALRLQGRGAEAVPVLRDALDRAVAADDEVIRELERWTVLVNNLPAELWDVATSSALLDEMERSERARGALASLRITLGAKAHIDTWCGRFSSADAAHEEAAGIATALGGDPSQWQMLKIELCAWRGEDEITRLMAEVMTGEIAVATGAGVILNIGRNALITLDLGQSRFEEALAVALAAAADDIPPQGNQCLAGLVEAAARCKEDAVAADAVARIEERAAASPTPWSLGIRARARALVADDDAAEAHYQESISHLEASGVATELARSLLLHGEWLRRRNRRADAREQLRRSHEMFAAMGARAFEERARIELAATGERARRRVPDTSNDLTPQEQQIATLAAQGQTNREIAAVLFISPTTVDYHLRKVFRKLDVSSRRQLGRVLPQS